MNVKNKKFTKKPNNKGFGCLSLIVIIFIIMLATGVFSNSGNKDSNATNSIENSVATESESSNESNDGQTQALNQVDNQNQVENITTNTTTNDAQSEVNNTDADKSQVPATVTQGNTSNNEQPVSQKPAATAPQTVDSQQTNDNNQNQIVYITKTGHKYHVAGCRYLKKSEIPITLKDAKAEGYTPCEVCHPPQ